jgi:hypothetical protein
MLKSLPKNAFSISFGDYSANRLLAVCEIYHKRRVSISA